MGPIENLQSIVDTVCEDMEAHLGRGRVADYIPALARVDPRHFGIALVTCDGRTAAAGDAHTPFSIQSISKVFTLSLALERLGADLWQRVGREPSGSRFNSIVQLEKERGIPRNPLINAGALVVTDSLLEGRAALCNDRRNHGIYGKSRGRSERVDRSGSGAIGGGNGFS